ncbi:heat-inducible transcriptional repressor HrcA [Xylocopilactobacillus apicola]|uniref:Heat-inducible transcription repressor HrcA n=1 Tax=Xylocopilactobacillus apicola TaxID=2932184 RepID=A0AAU9DEM9_9LACO|nr:heat-inducible transcriptional repressor HrcA [Xylocopilactobacillus apicola]BDR58350.1 heat-inducible transcription repressor HrcA [Xylocopilactobacillus apicola]
MLSKRQRIILKEIIVNYAVSGHAVGSKYLQSASGLDVSSATIRNEMAELEGLGLIEKTHLSSGRIPSLDGFHYYFENILRPVDVSKELRAKIKAFMQQAESKQIDDMIKESTELLSKMTDYMSVSFSPEASSSKIEDFQIMVLQNQKVILLATDNFGRIAEQIVFLDAKILGLFTAIAKRLEANLVGKTIKEAKDCLLEFETEDEDQSIIELLKVYVDRILDDLARDHYYIEGEYNLLNYVHDESPDTIKQIITFVNSNSDDFMKLIKKIGLSSGSNTRIQFVPHLMNADFDDFILISAPFDTKYLQSGMLAVLGPQMMPYSKMLAIVDTFRDELQERINSIEDMDKEV